MREEKGRVIINSEWVGHGFRKFGAEKLLLGWF